MRRMVFGLVVLVLAATGARAQAINDQAKAMLGTWEFSNADRDKTCNLTFKNDKAASGFKLEFDAKCADDLPLLRDVAGWTYPDNDLLHFVDRSGKPLVDFSEVETGMFEAPTPGFGVLFLQNSADAAAKPVPLEQVTGDWALMRGTGKPLCIFTFTTGSAEEGFALTVKPDCDPSIARLGFAWWKIDRDELLIAPSRGNPWRFEQDDANAWERVPESANPYRLVRQ
ncbi:MAG TPA: AprI/Inh family metalloprotease inhibitor [Pseudolabrys sp.]|nr:AprI/Inh family metalloprotease inhibitor [Pseudolabrys sp.]